ncbi:MAG: PASTA domain-containing protein [Treponema sp.]|nr:PASTA domain-containing protein [Treponema sp.]
MELKNKIKLSRFSFHSFMEKLQTSTLALVLTVISAIILMACACLAVFFIHVRGPEEVMVPEVKGKALTDALIEMQNKELYPKITLRYSENPGDEGTILDQSPSAGSIVKGYSRVSLVVSRGVIVDKVEDYIGMNYDELKLKLQTLFAGSVKPLIILADPEYKADVSDAGTILEQDPPEGTEISEPVTLKLVVSRGPNFDNTRVPFLKGSSVNDMLQTISRSRIIFDFDSHTAASSEKAGTVVAQEEFEGEFIKNYTRMTVEFAFPAKDAKDSEVYGIFRSEVTDYPYPVPMRVDVTTEEEGTYTLLSFNHTGGKVSIPYKLPKNSSLTLYVVDKAVNKLSVH